MFIKTIRVQKDSILVAKLADYGQLIKFRLSFLVVFSSLIAFFYGGGISLVWWKGLFLVLGGFMVTGSANAINQLIEKNLDKLMDRTKDRPLPSLRMTRIEASLAAVGMGSVGLTLLFFINPLTAVLGALALVLYSFVYTPMKQVSPIAVLIGAIPGALSPVLGWTAATGNLGYEAWVFFFIQFAWQFPHFWAIAWVADDDYAKAGFHLLPSKIGKDKKTALWIFFSALLLIPISLIPYFLHMGGKFLLVVSVLAGLVFLYQTIKLIQTCSVKSAYRLMFGSFFYLPLVQLALLIDKLF